MLSENGYEVVLLVVCGLLDSLQGNQGPHRVVDQCKLMYPNLVGVKIGYDEINIGKTSDKIFSSIKTKKKSRKNGKNYQRSNDQFVESNKLDHPWNSARPSSANGRAGSNTWSSSENGRAESNADSARPFAELDQPSWANGRAGSNADSARPFAELDHSSSANGRAESTRVCVLTRPRNSSPEIASNSFLFRLDQRYHWNFKIEKPQELFFS